ncbi:LOW QUALITY PROTEIN: non-muscle caldesmon-like [Plectropomus leopardus]|uniref:LOW QUALITY PROTEIN: non-muscle caldesmon-like n=1 Tax=Plectropomus leopardus TaxID=160734 RepID=UPI001C4CFAF9|nr:LOW QUALITY PROTEIN: non-muscle caldesmon-like [Plectropomus leopardus]
MRTTWREERAATKQRERGQREPQRRMKKSERAAEGKHLSLQDQDRGQTRDHRLHDNQSQNQDHRPGAAQSTMSESIRRKSSSRQLLQNLISLTAQRSQEDAEELERERRRRARETQREQRSPSWPEPPQHNELCTHSTELDEELKPRCCLVLEEDEGFSDWSHRLESRNEQEVQDDCRARVQRPPQWKPEAEEEKQQQEKEEEEGGEPQQSSQSQEASTRPPEKLSSNRKEGRMSYSSSVFMSQDARLQHAMGQPADRTSYLAAGTMRPRGSACRVDGEVEQEKQKGGVQEMQAALQREWRSVETRQSPRDEDDQEEEELSFTHEEKADLHLRREEKQQEDEEQKDREEEEHKTPDKRPVEGRRSEEVTRRSAVSLCSSSEGEESVNYGPMSPTFKKLLIQFYPDEVNSRVSTDGKCTIIERAESLKKSTSNIKKTPPPVAVSKIDKKLEQYTHALEVSSKEGRSGHQVMTDLTSPSEPVSSKKTLFEAGEAWNQNAISFTPSKDADGLKVGVADLISQWVRGSEDGSRCSSPSRPADMKHGGVLNKKNLWESFGDTLSPGREGKESSTSKRYKFVVTGHGKYEKVSVDSDCNDDANCQSAGHFYEDL